MLCVTLVVDGIHRFRFTLYNTLSHMPTDLSTMRHTPVDLEKRNMLVVQMCTHISSPASFSPQISRREAVLIFVRLIRRLDRGQSLVLIFEISLFSCGGTLGD